MRNKKVVRLTEIQLHNIIAESVKRVLREGIENDFYSEPDMDGRTGKPGMVKSYEMGHSYVSDYEMAAEEQGVSLEDYLKYTWEDISNETPFTWQKLGNGYGYHGDTILKLGNVVFKDIYGQLMVDEYPPR